MDILHLGYTLLTQEGWLLGTFKPSIKFDPPRFYLKIKKSETRGSFVPNHVRNLPSTKNMI